MNEIKFDVSAKQIETHIEKNVFHVGHFQLRGHVCSSEVGLRR